jgi:hypothetical protein
MRIWSRFQYRSIVLLALVFVLIVCSNYILFSQPLPTSTVQVKSLDSFNSQGDDYGFFLIPVEKLYGSENQYANKKLMFAYVSSTRNLPQGVARTFCCLVDSALNILEPLRMFTNDTSTFASCTIHSRIKSARENKIISVATIRTKEENSLPDIYIFEERIKDSSQVSLLNYMTLSPTHKAIRLPDNVNSPDWDAQPTMTSTGDTIYFVSNRNPSNRTDIFVTYRIKDETSNKYEWTDAEPLPVGINTLGDERSPFISSDGRTLYYSSNGNKGDQLYDIYSSTFDGKSWSAPVRVPLFSSTAENELFYAVFGDTAKKYFSSTLGGNKSGLQVYEISSITNPIKPREVVCSITDSATQFKLPGTVVIRRTRTGDTLSKFTYPKQSTVQLLPGDTVDITITSYNKTHTERKVIKSPLESDSINFSFEYYKFDFNNYSIPFFVSGYYRLNTKEELPRLAEQQQSIFKNTTYIERVAVGTPAYSKYEAYTETVEKVLTFASSVGKDTLFPLLTDVYKNDTLIIEITGYADPKPIIGSYIENESIDFLDSSGMSKKIVKNTILTNELLSGLRAAKCKEYLEQRWLATSKDFRALQQQKRIRIIPISGGTNLDKQEFAERRKISIHFKRAKGK